MLRKELYWEFKKQIPILSLFSFFFRGEKSVNNAHLIIEALLDPRKVRFAKKIMVFESRPEISVFSERARRAHPPKFQRARQEKSVPGKKARFTILLTAYFFLKPSKEIEIATSEITRMFIIVERFDALLKKPSSYQR